MLSVRSWLLECFRAAEIVAATWGRICLFQHHLKELVIGNGSSFISNASKLNKWLLDVNVSGKSAGLRLTDSGKDVSMWPFEKAEVEESKLRSVFGTSMPTNLLLNQASQLVLAPTQDMTDAEVLAVPLGSDISSTTLATENFRWFPVAKSLGFRRTCWLSCLLCSDTGCGECKCGGFALWGRKEMGKCTRIIQPSWTR